MSKKMKRTHRLRKKLLKKRFPFSDEWKPRRTRYRERLHSCPVCENARRSGFYRSCPKCTWIFEWRKKLEGLVEQANASLENHNARLRVFFLSAYNAHIGCEITAYCDPQEITNYQRNSDQVVGEFEVEYKARVFNAEMDISLHDLRFAEEPKKDLLDLFLLLFKKAKEEIENYIDKNGVMKTVAGVPLPIVQGNWAEPHRKDHKIYVRK